MGEFNAATEAKTLNQMLIGFANEIGARSGGPASERLMDAVNREWCNWQPDQRGQIASSMDEQKDTLYAKPVKDGSGQIVGLSYNDFYVLPIRCE